MKKLILSVLFCITAVVLFNIASQAQGNCPKNADLKVTLVEQGGGMQTAIIEVTWDHTNNGKKTLEISMNGGVIAVIDISKMDGYYNFPNSFLFNPASWDRITTKIYSGGNDKKECWSETWQHPILEL